MVIRTISWTVDDKLRVTPRQIQEAGIQGEHEATQVVFVLPAELGAYRLYLEYIGGDGTYDVTGALPYDKATGTVSFPLPRAWTQGGGTATLRLVAEEMTDAAKHPVAYSVDARIRYADRQEATALERRLLEGPIVQAFVATEQLAERAVTAAETAEKAADTATEQANAAGQSASDAATARDSAAGSAKKAKASEEAAEADKQAAESAVKQAAYQVQLATERATAAAGSATAAEESKSKANESRDTVLAALGDVGDIEEALDSIIAMQNAFIDKTALSEEGVPLYWEPALDEGARAINEAVLVAGCNKSAFLFYSDVHWNYGAKRSPELLKYLYTHTAISKTVFGGDIVNDEGVNYNTMSYLWEWRARLKGLPNHHSVVGNHDDGNTTNNLFGEQYVYGYLLAAEETPDIVRGEKGLYYYIDNSPEKTRYLYLDTACKGVDSAQKEFVKEALLSTPEGWHIVAIAHIWYAMDYTTTPPIIGGLDTNAEVLLSMFDAYNARTGDYADCGGWVEFCIGGHTHVDYDGTTDTGIPIILVETDSQHVRSGLNFTPGTTTEASINGVVADYDNHKIHIIRIGRGESREVSVTNCVVTYTNVLALIEIGYQADREISTSTYEERDSDSGYDLTGYIPISNGDVFRLKNIIMPDGVSDRRNMVYLFEGDKAWNGNYSLCTTDINGAGFSPVFEEGNLVQFTVPAGGYDGMYIRLNAQQIDETSIITINEPIE